MIKKDFNTCLHWSRKYKKRKTNDFCVFLQIIYPLKKWWAKFVRSKILVSEVKKIVIIFWYKHKLYKTRNNTMYT